MRAARRLVGVALLCTVGALAFAAAPAHAADYVGMGDSYSSGTGTDNDDGDACILTQYAYPTLVDAQLPGSGVNISCSGAQTEDILTNSQNGNPPQIQRSELGADTDYVTLQIGGNDAGFVPVLTDCANPFGDCSGSIQEARETAQNVLPARLRATYDAVRAKAPSAVVVVVGYPRIFRPNQTCNTFFSSSEVNQLNDAAQELGEITREIAHEKGFAYADPIFGSPTFIGHGACDSAEWINGLSLTFSNSYHPNATGHSSGYTPLTMNTLNAIPSTTIGSTPAPLSNNTSPQVSFSGSGTAASFQCRLDGAAWAACASPKSFPGTAQGQHTIAVRALNAAGDMDQSPVSSTFTIDTTPPPVTIDPNQGPTGTVGTDSAAFAFSSTDGSATFECKLDAGAFEPCTSPKSYTGLSSASHTFTVRATDAASNSATASRTWTVDTDAPAVTIDSGPNGTTSSTSASFQFSSNETIALYECSLDGAPFLPCVSPQPYTGLGNGEHTFTVRGTDVSIPPHTGSDTYTWTVDLTPPETTIDSQPPNPSGIVPANGTTGSVSFEFGANEPGSNFECRLDVPSQPAGTFSSCSSPKSYTGLAGSGLNYTFHVRATDTVGNVDPTPSTYSWRVDTTRPVANLGAKPQTPSGPDVAFGILPGGVGDTYRCKLDQGDYAPCTFPLNYTGLSDGPHVFFVKAVDAAGNEQITGIQNHSWTVDATPPVSSITGGPADGSTSNQASPQFTFSASDNHAGAMTFECAVDNGAFAPCTSPKQLTGLSDGEHTFGVRATDPQGNQETQIVATRTWTVDTTAPDTAIDTAPSGPENSTSAEITFSSAAGDLAGFDCSLDGASFAPCTSPANLTGLSQGPHTYAVRARDGAGNADPTPASASWTVDTVAPQTSIDSGPSGPTASTGATVEFSSSEGGSSFSCSLDGGASAPCTSPRSLTGLSQGGHTLSVTASDAAGNADSTPATRTWTVDTVAPDTAFTSAPPASTTDTSATFAFSTEAGSSFECRLDGDAFAACTSPRSLTGLSVGSHTFRVRATDAAGNPEAAAAEHTWTVTQAPTPPGSQQQGSQGQASPGTGAATTPTTSTCRKPKKKKGKKAKKCKSKKRRGK